MGLDELSLSGAHRRSIRVLTRPFCRHTRDLSNQGLFKTISTILQTIFLPRASSYKFQQDGASVHRSRSTKTWLQANHFRMFYNDAWPPNSPDMNPIEHLWPMVGHKLKGRIFNSKDQLWDALQSAFASISPAQVIRLYDSMPSRLSHLKLAKGGYTRY